MRHNGLPPIIIIGMHRSGTSMAVRLLERLGLFMGHKRREPNDEAVFFLSLNRWLLTQCGGSWDHPKALHYFLRHDELSALAVKYLRYITNAPGIANYLGWKRYLKYRSLSDIDFPWGWKDPRNTFTLPLWLEIFPDAKIIHVRRHGIDVAKSLHVREHRKHVIRSHPVNDWRRHMYVLRPKRGGFSDSARCATLEGGFSLWEEYLAEASAHARKLKDSVVEIRYEDLLEEPSAELASLARFCELRCTKEEISEVSKDIDKTRAYAYRNKADLNEFEEKVRERLRVYGY